MEIIRKWGLGALARRRFKRLVQGKTIAGLRKPKYIDGKFTHTDEVLMDDNDLGF